MEDKENKRLRKFVYISWGLILLFSVFATGYFSFQLHDLRNLIALQKPIVVNGIDGKNGTNGVNGLSIVGQTGRNGIDGKDGTTTVINNTVVQNVPVPGEKGATGEKGNDGTPGNEVQLSKDSDGNILWKYTTDRYWQVLDIVPEATQ